MPLTQTKAQNLIFKELLLLKQKLLRSFDPTTVGVVTGDNALHRICRLFAINSSKCWSYKLAEMLIVRGVKLDQCNKEGNTPLLQLAVYCKSSSARISSDAVRLFLEHGADLNAHDHAGETSLHHLVRKGALVALENFLSGSGVGHTDFTLRNSAGQTAADVYAIQRGNDRSFHIHKLLIVQPVVWAKHTRPALALCLDAVLPIVDVAKLALTYIDGSGFSLRQSRLACNILTTSLEFVTIALSCNVIAQKMNATHILTILVTLLNVERSVATFFSTQKTKKTIFDPKEDRTPDLLRVKEM